MGDAGLHDYRTARLLNRRTAKLQNCRTLKLPFRKFSYLYFMQCFINTNRDIYFNLALEEYLLMHKLNNFFVLWQSEPAVVVGKHQNTLAEINYRFVTDKWYPGCQAA